MARSQEGMKGLRKSRGYTQRKLADESGVPLPEISRIEREGTFSLRQFTAIAEVLQPTFGELMGRSDA